jgi:hypothetical protein
MIACEGYRACKITGGHSIVNHPGNARPVAVGEPGNPRGQPLELDVLLR